MIQRIFDLRKLEKEFVVDGICNINKKGVYGAEEIPLEARLKLSRGEFVGYYSTPGCLSLFRDRLGGRNLYYAREHYMIIIGQDPYWVMKQLGLKPQLNLDYINSEYLEFQVPFDHETIYQNVYRVMPGEMFTISITGKYEFKKYWSLKFGEEKFNPKDLLDLILDAVSFRKNLLDGLFTLYLSGGIDSSTITCLAKPEQCYSGFYEVEGYLELNYIETLIREGKIEVYHPVLVTEERFRKFLTHLPMIMPDPMGGLGIIPQLIVAMEAYKGGYFYAFTGEGGDEVFSGYNWNTLVIEQARAARGLLRDRYMIRYEPMIEKLLKEGYLPMVANLIARGTNTGKHIELLEKVWDKSQPIENNIMKINIEIGLPAILTVDECVGKYSRVMPVSPLIDHAIVDYVASINPEERTKVPKYLLREAMRGILPEKIRTRGDKLGFPVPIEQWSWPMLPDVLRSLKKRGIINFDVNYYKTMTRQAWGLVNIELICRRLEELPDKKETEAFDPSEHIKYGM